MSDKSNANQVSNDNSPIATISARVTFQDEKGKEYTYTLTDPTNVNVEKGFISINSPVGKALLGSKTDDEVEVIAPRGKYKVSIKSVS